MVAEQARAAGAGRDVWRGVSTPSIGDFARSAAAQERLHELGVLIGHVGRDRVTTRSE